MTGSSDGRGLRPDDGLLVSDLTVRFGGRAAVVAVNLQVPVGTITGLIGPNGAGKTTTFNACSGLNRPSSGSLALFGKDIRHLGVSQRARLGLGRTFQRMELCQDLSVWENVELGAESAIAGASPLRQLVATRSERRDVKERVRDAMVRCGLDGDGARPVGSLSTGKRRLVELARVIAAGSQVLLLDEPSSGLDTSETERIAQILLDVARERNLGILLVEHDIALVRAVCSYIYVLDFGAIIEEGPVSQVLASAAVAAAYLGTEAVSA